MKSLFELKDNSNVLCKVELIKISVAVVTHVLNVVIGMGLQVWK